MTWMRRATALVATVPTLLTGIRLSGWWPCDVACQGGGFYQRLGGIDILWPALIGYLVLGGLALFDGFRRPRWSTATCVVAGLLGGASLFYLWVAWSLELLPGYRLLRHSLAISSLSSHLECFARCRATKAFTCRSAGREIFHVMNWCSHNK